MPENPHAGRRFVCVSIDRAVDSSEKLTAELNRRLEQISPAANDMHFLQAISHDGRVLVFFRELDPRGAGGRK